MHTNAYAERTDDVLQVLSHSYRRQILRYLIDTPDNTATTDELLTHVNEPRPAQEALRPQQVATEIHHIHLPKLADSELMEWDLRSETVRYTPHTGVEQLLHTIERYEGEPIRP